MLVLLSVLACGPAAPPVLGSLHHGTLPAVAFTELSLDRVGACGRADNGRVTCWRHDGQPARAAPAAAFVAHTGGGLGGCGVDGDGLVTCWGLAASPGPGPYAHLAGTTDGLCGLRRDGGVDCSGADLAPPTDLRGVTDLVVVDGTACAGTAQDLTCWGAQPRHYDRPFDHLALSGLGRCGIGQDARLNCDIDLTGGTPSLDEVVEVGLGDHHLCATRSGGRVHCFGRDRSPGIPPGQPVEGLVVRGGTSCALDRATHHPVCWGGGYALGVPQDRVLAVAVASTWGCALVEGGDLACFGTLPEGLLPQRPGPFRGVSAESFNGVALRGDHTPDGWGNPRLAGGTPPPGEFAMVDAGHGFTCGLDTRGEVACWGPQAGALGVAPKGPWEAVSVGSRQACAVGSGRLACWGPGALAVPEAGPWSAVSVGRGATCATLATGDVRCWGRGPQTSDPPHPLRQVVAGDRVHCGLEADGHITCWGAPVGAPPPGVYVDLAVASEDGDAEGALVCGRTATHHLDCTWN